MKSGKPLELGEPSLAHPYTIADFGCFGPIHCLGSVLVPYGSNGFAFGQSKLRLDCSFGWPSGQAEAEFQRVLIERFYVY